MTRTAYDLREKRIICRPFGIDKRKSDLKCISEIHHIVKTAEFDMGVEESYEYGKCNKDNQNTGNCRVAETKNIAIAFDRSSILSLFTFRQPPFSNCTVMTFFSSHVAKCDRIILIITEK